MFGDGDKQVELCSGLVFSFQATEKSASFHISIIIEIKKSVFQSDFVSLIRRCWLCPKSCAKEVWPVAGSVSVG